MSRSRRAMSFLFEPARFKNDEAVRMMSLEARGAYAILFCELWDQPEPGVVPDDDRLLASLARATPEEWVRIGSDVRRAFDAQQRPGYLVQRGLVATVKAQDRFIASQSHAGHVAAKARWDKEKMRFASDAQPTPDASRSSPSVLGSRFSGSDSQATPSRKSTHLPAKAGESEHFAAFYAAYPRKTKRPDAAKAWRQVDAESQLEAIAAGLSRWREVWTDPQFVPYPATWLRARQWNDEPRAAVESQSTRLRRAAQAMREKEHANGTG